MKLAFHGATSLTTDLVTEVMATGQAGFRGLELWAAKVEQFLQTHSLSELRALLADNGVAPIAISSIEFIGFRGQEFQGIRDRCRELSEIAASIDCPVLVVVPSPTPRPQAGAVLDLVFPWNAVVDEYVTVLRDLSDIAHPYGVGLSFEFLAFAWSSVRTPRGAFEIVQKTDRENVGMNFDTCHFYGGGGQLDEIAMLDPKRIYAFHLNDLEDVPKEAITDSIRLLPGLGVIPLDDICARLKAIGFDGHCSIELFRPEYWDWDPYELTEAAYKAAIEVLSPHFDVV